MPPERRLQANQIFEADFLPVLKVLTLNTGHQVQVEMFSGVDDQNIKSMRERAASGPPWLIASTLAAGVNGIDIGGPPFPFTFYFVYVIDDSTGVSPTATLLSQNPGLPWANPVMPPGYDLKRRVAAVLTDPGGNLYEQRKFGQFVLYTDFSTKLIHTGNVPGGITPVAVSPFVPVTAERVLLQVEVWDMGAGILEFCSIYSQHIGGVAAGPTSMVRASTGFPGVTQVNSQQAWAEIGNNIFIAGTGALSSFANIWVAGYWEDYAPAV